MNKTKMVEIMNIIEKKVKSNEALNIHDIKKELLELNKITNGKIIKMMEV